MSTEGLYDFRHTRKKKHSNSHLISLVSLKLASVAIGFLIFLVIIFFILRKYILRMKYLHKKLQNGIRIGVFHPYCNAGGGGERVLWCAIRALQQQYADKIHITIYTGDLNVAVDRILLNAKNVFNVSVDAANIDFVFLQRRHWIEPKRYPRLTLVGQSIGSMILAMEALLKYQPDVFIDTMGYAFTYPIFRYLGGCKVGAYTHYPTVSQDMMREVFSKMEKESRSPEDKKKKKRNAVRNPFVTWLKWTYYRLFAKVCLNRSHIVILIFSWCLICRFN